MGEDNFCGVKIPFLLVCFSFRDYIARLTNFMLWISLVSVTFLLVRQLGRLVRLWVKGNRIPGPPCPSFLAGHSKIVGRCGSARDLTESYWIRHSRITELFSSGMNSSQRDADSKKNKVIDKLDLCQGLIMI